MKKIMMLCAAMIVIGITMSCKSGQETNNDTIPVVNDSLEAVAVEEIFAAEQWYAQGHYEKALYGDDTYSGFLDVIQNYGTTKVGNLAKYYAGTICLHIGNYSDAIRWLSEYYGEDNFSIPINEIELGDAEIEIGNTQKAISHYCVASQTGNEITIPMALFKEGQCYLLLGDKAKALEIFQTIKQKYPSSTEWSEVDHYIAIAEK